ncbi:WXG100 family type VII secretion target [Nocardia sp. NPDC101769]|uniref:WXG100 family type VII secretion target n=1 Tax=Nocardia sp. NPDC101769 TaxID=3364333 RepID=UPI003811D436
MALIRGRGSVARGSPTVIVDLPSIGERAVVATKVGVTPAQLRGAAGRMRALEDRVDGILATLERSLAQRGMAWGDDSYGSAFADGAQGYSAAHSNLHDGIRNMATTLGSYAQGQDEAADSLERMDHGNANRYR